MGCIGCSGNRNGGLCVCVCCGKARALLQQREWKALGSPVKCRIHSNMYWAPTGARHSPYPGCALADVTVRVLTSSCVVVMCAAVCRRPGQRQPPFYPRVSLIRGWVHAGSAHQPKELCREGSFARESVRVQVPFLMHLTWDKAHSRVLPSPPRHLRSFASCRALVPHWAVLFPGQGGQCRHVVMQALKCGSRRGGPRPGGNSWPRESSEPLAGLSASLSLRQD